MEISQGPRRGWGGEGEEGKDCEEGQGVCVGHSWTIFEITTKGRVQGCKKVLLKETRAVVLIDRSLVLFKNIYFY